MKDNIELHLAFVYDCDNCGKENFVRSIRIEADEDTMQELMEEHGVQPYEIGEYQQAPTTVKCTFCGTEYNTE